LDWKESRDHEIYSSIKLWISSNLFSELKKIIAWVFHYSINHFISETPLITYTKILHIFEVDSTTKEILVHPHKQLLWQRISLNLKCWGNFFWQKITFTQNNGVILQFVFWCWKVAFCFSSIVSSFFFYRYNVHANLISCVFLWKNGFIFLWHLMNCWFVGLCHAKVARTKMRCEIF